MDNIKDISLKKCLEHLHISDLPKQLKNENKSFWLEAIVLVKKLDYSHSYAIAKKNADGKITYISDFGNLSPIKALISIHPHVYLDMKKYMPYADIDQKRMALSKFIGGDKKANEAVEKLKDDDVDYTLLKIAIKRQYNDMYNKISGDEVTEMVYSE